MWNAQCACLSSKLKQEEVLAAVWLCNICAGTLRPQLYAVECWDGTCVDWSYLCCNKLTGETPGDSSGVKMTLSSFFGCLPEMFGYLKYTSFGLE